MTIHDAFDFERENWFNRSMNRWHPDLAHYTHELHEKLDHPAQLGDDGGGHKNRGSKPGSKPPWNQAAANMFFDIHSEIRRTESALTLALHHRAVYRGGSDAVTQHVLNRLPILLRALRDRDINHPLLDDTFRTLISLTRRARSTLHPDERRTRAPWVLCHECDGDLWIYRTGHDLHPRLTDNTHLEPGDAYCNHCGTWYPQDIWQKVAREKARVA